MVILDDRLCARVRGWLLLQQIPMMNDKQIHALAKATGVDANTLARWHHVHGPLFHRKSARRGKLPRPRGMLVISELQKVLGLDYSVVKRWLRIGLKKRKFGRLVLVRETDVRKLLEEREKSRK